MNRIRSFCFLLVLLITSGCAVNRSNGESITSKENAIIVGQVSEGYLTLPHGLYIKIISLDTSKVITLSTKGHEDEIISRNILGNKFMYEVPPGKYEISKWGYVHYNGRSKKPKQPIVFEVKAGEAAYIGNFHANALRFCLYNKNKFGSIENAIKTKFPVLSDYKIQDQAKNIAFYNWGHDQSEAFADAEACDQPIKYPPPNLLPPNYSSSNDNEDQFSKGCDFKSLPGKEFFFGEQVFKNKTYDYNSWFRTSNPRATTPVLRYDEYVGKRAKGVKHLYLERSGSKRLMIYVAVTEDCETIYGNISDSGLQLGQSSEGFLEKHSGIRFLEPVIEKAKVLIGKNIWAAMPLGPKKADFIFTPNPNVSYPKRNLDHLKVIGIDTTRYGHIYGGKIYDTVPLFLVVETENGKEGLIPYDIKNQDYYYYELNPVEPNWDEQLVTMMKNQDIKLGMTDDQVWISWGEPKDWESISRHSNSFRWTYNNGQSLEFKNGILTKIN